MTRTTEQTEIVLAQLNCLSVCHPYNCRQPMALDADFAASGPPHAQVRSTFGLSAAEFSRVATNVKNTAAMLRESCRAGRLRFDADPAAFLTDGKAVEQDVDCDNPQPGG